jgi:hypothetical protein
MWSLKNGQEKTQHWSREEIKRSVADEGQVPTVGEEGNTAHARAIQETMTTADGGAQVVPKQARSCWNRKSMVLVGLSFTNNYGLQSCFPNKCGF